MHRRVPSARCSATQHCSSLRSLADAVGPYFTGVGGARGVRADVLALRRFDPAERVECVFPRLRAHVPLSLSRPPRLISVGVTRSFARGRSETLASAASRANERIGAVMAIDFWASLPSAVRPRRRPLTLNSSTRSRRSMKTISSESRMQHLIHPFQ
jgi:hypothetical protein